MPLNPLTGEIEGYDSPSTIAGIGMTAMAAAEMDVPLAFRMLEDLPGFISTFGFSINRGANTLIKGGSKPSLLKFDPTTGTFDRSKDFFGSGRIIRGKGAIGRRATRLAADSTKTAFLRPALRTNSLRPRNLTQLTDLSAFADSKYKRYTPFGASGFLGNTKAGTKLASKLGVESTGGASLYGPGLLSAITASTRIDRMEAKALSAMQKGKTPTRLLKKLGKVDENIVKLATMNNPSLLKLGAMGGTLHGTTATGVMPHAPKPAHARKAKNKNLDKNQKRKLGITKDHLDGQRTPITNHIMSSMESAVGGVTRTATADDLTKGIFRNVAPGYVPPQPRVGVRGDLMASSMPGLVNQKTLGYFRGARGLGLDATGEAAEGVAKAVGNFAAGIGKEGITTKAGTYFADDAAKLLGETNLFRNLGTKGVGQLVQTGGLKTAGVLGARAASMAIPGLNIIATASLVYDLGRMAGEVVKSGIELARDAGRSLQGTIAKPMFGMGYKDTEAAATSRSRGVMAIQNSRLNMRSLLGSEAAMMAAHYG